MNCSASIKSSSIIRRELVTGRLQQVVAQHEGTLRIWRLLIELISQHTHTYSHTFSINYSIGNMSRVHGRGEGYTTYQVTMTINIIYLYLIFNSNSSSSNVFEAFSRRHRALPPNPLKVTASNNQLKCKNKHQLCGGEEGERTCS